MNLVDSRLSMKKMNSIPLICGILSIAAFLIYFYSANHAPYSYTDIIVLGPVFSFVGLIFSIITRKERTLIWWLGLLLCILGFLGCIMLFMILVMFLIS